jgi:hypothetical protein
MITKETTSIAYNEDGNGIITVISGPYKGIVYQYGRTWIDIVDGEPVMGFEYDAHPSTPVPEDLKKRFEEDAAYFLHSLILEKLEDHSVTYTGGTDDTDPEIRELVAEASSSLDIGDKLVKNVGEFVAKKDESAMSFLDRLAAEGMSSMGREKGILR